MPVGRRRRRLRRPPRDGVEFLAAGRADPQDQVYAIVDHQRRAAAERVVHHAAPEAHDQSEGAVGGDGAEGGDAEEDLQPAGDEQEHGDDRSGSGMFLASGVRSEGVVATPGVLQCL